MVASVTDLDGARYLRLKRALRLADASMQELLEALAEEQVEEGEG